MSPYQPLQLQYKEYGILLLVGLLERREKNRKRSYVEMGQRGELKNVLDGLGAEVLKEVTKELQNNPQIRKILSQANLGKAAKDAFQNYLTAPLTEQIREGNRI